VCFFKFYVGFFFLGMLIPDVGVLGETRQSSIGMCLRCVDGYTLDLTRKGERFLWWDRSPVSARKCYWISSSAWAHSSSSSASRVCPYSFWPDFLSSPFGVCCTYAHILPSAYFSLPRTITHPISLISKRQRLHSDSFYITRSIYGWHSHRLTDTTAIPTTTSHSHRSWSWSFRLCT